MFSNTDELFEDAIMQSTKTIEDHVFDQDDDTQQSVSTVAGSMLIELMESLGPLASEVLGNKAWVAGFTSAIATAMFLAADDDCLHSTYECRDGHTHQLVSYDMLSSYLETAVFGILQGYHMQTSLERMLEGGGQDGPMAD